jgi:hypothetical protein
MWLMQLEPKNMSNSWCAAKAWHLCQPRLPFPARSRHCPRPWVGDANLDGIVTASDFAAISPLGTTWARVDFNYDGKDEQSVRISDYRGRFGMESFC